MKSFKIFNLYEIIWFISLVLFSIIIPPIIEIFILNNSISWDYYVTTIATICGAISVLLVAKGNIFNVPFGIVEVCLFGSLAFVMGYYGDAFMNLLFLLPAICIGGFLWFKKLKNKTEVQMRRLNFYGWLLIIAISLIVGFSIFQGIKYSNISLEEAILDSTTTALQVVAMLLMITRFREQWIIWIAFNILTIILYSYGLSYLTGGVPAHAISTIITYSGYLLNSIYGFIIWTKKTNKEILNKSRE